MSTQPCSKNVMLWPSVSFLTQNSSTDLPSLSQYVVWDYVSLLCSNSLSLQYVLSIGIYMHNMQGIQYWIVSLYTFVLLMCMSVLVFDLSVELARTYSCLFLWPSQRPSRPWGSHVRVWVLVALEAGPSASCTEINRAANSPEQVVLEDYAVCITVCVHVCYCANKECILTAIR